MTNDEIMNVINQMELKSSQVEALSAIDLENRVNDTVNDLYKGDFDSFMEEDETGLRECWIKLDDWYNNHDNDETPIILWLYNWADASEKYTFLENVNSVILHDYIGANGVNLYYRNKILDLKDNYITNILS